MGSVGSGQDMNTKVSKHVGDYVDMISYHFYIVVVKLGEVIKRVSNAYRTSTVRVHSIEV